MPEIVIIGAGLAGLSAAYHAEEKNIDHEIYEQERHVGGLCRTIEKEGFYFDYSGHLLHLKDPYFQSLIQDLLGNNLSTIKRNSFIYSKGVFTRYPFQANLYGLRPEVIEECLIEFVRAYYENQDLPTKSYRTFYDWIAAKLGIGIGRYFMFPYNEKLWTVSTEELTCEWISEYVPRPTLEDVFNGSFFDQKKSFGYNATFWYPRKGGIQALCDAFATHIHNLRLGLKVAKVIPGEKSIEINGRRIVEYDKLISTVPLKTLVLMLEGNIPKEVRDAAKKLRHNSVLIANLGVKGDNLTDKHWIYLPEKQYTAYRIGVYSNFSENMAPEGTTSYYIEIAYQQNWNVNKERLVQKAITDMLEIGLIKTRDDIIVTDVQDLEFAYVIYDRNYSESKSIIMNYLNEHDIFSVGRYGSWEYSGMEEAIRQGKTAIDSLV